MAKLNSDEILNEALDHASGLTPTPPQPPAPVAPQTPQVPPTPSLPGTGLDGYAQNPMAPTPDMAPADVYTPPDNPVPVGRSTRIPTAPGRYGEPDTDKSHQEGFDEVVQGYGAAPTPMAAQNTPVAAAPSQMEPGTPEWIAWIQVKRLTDTAGLQQYLTDNPHLFGAVQAAIDTGSVPTHLTQAPPVEPAAPAGYSGDYEQQQYLPAEEDTEPARKARAADRDDVAKLGARGWFARTLNIPLRKSRKELALDDMDVAADMVREVLSLDKALVLGTTAFKGGCGKSAVTVAMGKALAQILDETLAPATDAGDGPRKWAQGYEWNGRHLLGAVCVIDTDFYGMLRARSIPTTLNEVEHGPAVGMPYREAEQIAAANLSLMTQRATQFGDQLNVRDYVHPGVEPGYFFIPGSASAKEAAHLSPEGYPIALERLREKFAIILVDMSQAVEGRDGIYPPAVRTLDGLMVITPASEDASVFLDGTRNLLSSYTDTGLGADHLIKQRITVINNHESARSKTTSARIAAQLKLQETATSDEDNPRGSDVAEIPFDNWINANDYIDPDQLAFNTRYGAVMAAGALIDTTLNVSARQ